MAEEKTKQETINNLRARYHKLLQCELLLGAMGSSLDEINFASLCLDNSAKAVNNLISNIQIPGYHEILEMSDFEIGGRFSGSLEEGISNVKAQLSTASKKIDDLMAQISDEINTLKNTE